MDKYPNKFNVQPIAGSSLGVVCSQETRAKMSKSGLGIAKSKEARMKM